MGNKMKDEIIASHMFSSNHKENLSRDKKCGCFYCLEVFDPSKITEWLNEENGFPGGTALCPFCGVDSIIGESSGYPISKSFLIKMYDYWF